MMNAVKGHYNGTQIVLDEEVKMDKGQRVIITLLDSPVKQKEKPDLRKYMGRGRKMFHGGADAYVKELRANDRV